MVHTNVDVKRKRDRNNFIQVILSKIALARDFKQRIALTITSKVILRHVTLRFYLRKRYNDLYLFICLKDGFGSITERHRFYKDFVSLIPQLRTEGIKGHYTGFTLLLNSNSNDSLVLLLKLISLLSHPEDFYCKDTKIYKSFFNYPETSQTPIHLNFTLTKLKQLQCFDLYDFMFNVVKSKKEVNDR